MPQAIPRLGHLLLRLRTRAALAPMALEPRRPGRAARRALALMAPGLMMTLALCGLALPARAAWPERPIVVIVGYPPGGATDLIARSVSQKVAEQLGVSLVIESKPGAAGIIAMAAGARAAPDGYTLYFSSIGDIAIATALGPQQQNLLRDFAPVTGVANAPHILVVPASLPIRNVGQLLDYLRAAPGKYNYASIGVGTLAHLEGELLQMTTGVRIEHVPYKGSAQAMVDLLSGESTLMFVSSPSAVPHMKSGRARVLAVASPRRLPLLPDTPTIEEAGVKGFEAPNLFGFLAPRGTPAGITATLAAAIEKALGASDLRATFDAQGLEPLYTGPEGFTRLIERDYATFERIVRTANVKAN